MATIFFLFSAASVEADPGLYPFYADYNSHFGDYRRSFNVVSLLLVKFLAAPNYRGLA